MSEFTQLCPACLDCVALSKLTLVDIFVINTCDPSIFKMDHPDLVLCSFVSHKWVKRHFDR